ncbi:hypothetical protein [Maribacter polysaccharolyticus]|uniref:hypothetical protein n=1 Tax=Maribacter polysaccharolyticus TaxID=3020831 RepID=UPI00237F8BE2|nr:hypothetical protein [Maribacter polysaccharolyticus]MDE3743997.1 hypothetical protein [Maribacter polysaccharolyticus]
MKPYSYLTLDETAQWKQLWDLGTYLTHIEGDGYKYALYALGEFYVEVKYNLTDNRIVSKKQFRKGKTLHRYLSLFDLNIPI